MPSATTEPIRIPDRGTPGTVIWRHGMRFRATPNGTFGPAEPIISWRGQEFINEETFFKAVGAIYGASTMIGISEHCIEFQVNGGWLIFPTTGLYHRPTGHITVADEPTRMPEQTIIHAVR